MEIKIKQVLMAAMLSATISGAAQAFDLAGISAKDIPQSDVPKVLAVAVDIEPATKQLSYKDLVKNAYCQLLENDEVPALPVAQASELPPEAKKQMAEYDHDFGPDFLSNAYAMNVEGWPVYIIQNNNDGGMYVSIFSSSGGKLASGGQSESGDFYWDKQRGETARSTPASVQAERARFKSILAELARSSKTKPLKFQERIMGEPEPKEISFSLRLTDDPQYKDAFTVHFGSPERSFTTLVAYEGLNGYTMGTLQVTKDGKRTIYQHVFDGFFDDMFTITVVNGKVEGLVYDKVNPQGVSFDTLSYLP
jgi:hypothetical protein